MNRRDTPALNGRDTLLLDGRRALLRGLMVAGGGCAAGWLAQGTSARAQSAPFPSRPIRVLVGFSAGGGADAIARTLAQRLGEQFGQSVVVENRPGASSTIAAEVLATAAPDGYSLMLADSSLLIAAKAMAKVSFDVRKSFEPIGSVAIAPLALCVAADSPLTSLEQMAQAARDGNPKLVYASPGIGTVHHLAMESLLAQAKITMTHVPYRGASQILPDLLGGQVQIGVLSAGAAIGQVKAGKLRALGMTSPVKLPGAEWRAIADWLPGFDASPRLFLLAPAGTPAAVIKRLDGETHAAVSAPQVADLLLKQGAVAASGAREQLAAQIETELTRWDELIRRTGIVIGS